MMTPLAPVDTAKLSLLGQGYGGRWYLSSQWEKQLGNDLYTDVLHHPEFINKDQMSTDQ